MPLSYKSLSSYDERYIVSNILIHFSSKFPFMAISRRHQEVKVTYYNAFIHDIDI